MMSTFLFFSIVSALASADEGYRIKLTDIHPHRGGGKNPENTLYGFERNMRGGSYVWVYTSAGLTRLFANLDLLEKATGARRLMARPGSWNPWGLPKNPWAPPSLLKWKPSK